MPFASGTFRVYDDDEAKLKTYRHRLALADRDFDRNEQRILENLGRYRNDVQDEQLTPSGERTSDPTGIGVIDAMFSSLTAIEVDVIVKNVGGGTPEQATLASAALKDVWREQKVGKVKGPKGVKEALLCDIGWVKVAYEYAEQTVERDRPMPDIEAEVDDLMAEALQAGEAPPSPDDIAAAIPRTEEVVEVSRDRVVVDFVPWEQVRWDTSAKRTEDIRWMAQVTKLPVPEVVHNPAYREYVENTYGRKGLQTLDDLSGDSSITDSVLREAGHEVDEDDDRTTVYELWDFETGTVCVFAEGMEDLILDERPNPFAIHDDLEDKNPFVPFVVREDPARVRGISDATVIAPLLEELNELSADLSTYISRSIPKLLGPADAMTDSGREALQSREWGAYIELENGKDANDIKPMDPPQLPQEAFAVPEKKQQAVFDATGASEIIRGIFPDRKRTATETNAVTTMSTARQAEKRNRLELFYENIARRCLWLMQMFYDTERIARVVEDDADVAWEFTNEDIAAEMDLEIHLTPSEAYDQESRQERALGWFQMLAALPVVDLAELAKWAMEESGFDKAIIRKLIKLPEEVQKEQMQELQLQQQQQAVGEGEAPDPSGVPGPLPGADLAGTANEGEIPPELAAAIAEEEGAVPEEEA